MVRRNAGDEDAIVLLENLSGDFDDLDGRFAAAVNDLRKALPQRAVLVHLRKAKIGNRLLAERSQDFRLADFASTKLF